MDSKKILTQLKRSGRSSHKGDNGVLYIAAGSKQYHGALLYAVMAASYFVDLIYVETDPSNRAAIASLKLLHPAIILVTPRQRGRFLAKSNCLLLGPGLGRSTKTKHLVHTLLRHAHRPSTSVIDADALHYLTKRDLTAGTILTPHPGEYRACFGTVSPQQLSRTIPAVIMAKGSPAVICQNGKCQYNTIGIARFTKGGMGDVLAGLTAAFACTNSSWLAARAASLLLSLTTQQLERRVGTAIATTTLIQQLPLTLHIYESKIG